MAISAQRFNYLDRETNIGVKDFTKLIDNSIYSGFDELQSTAIETLQSNELINKVQNSLSDLSDMLTDNAVADSLKEAMDSAMAAISNMELPDTVKNIFESLKKLDLQGVKDFLSDALKVGSRFLCNNLDFLKLFMLGYSLNKNILSGLLIALLLSWLDRFCKGFTPEETAKADLLGKLGQVIPNPGTIVTADSAFSQFTNFYSDYLKSTADLVLVDQISQQDAVSGILNGDIASVVNNARSSEMSHADRNSLIGLLQSNLTSYSPQSQEYKNILKATGDLKNIPLVTIERRDNNLRYENLSDKFGSYIKNLTKVDLNNSSNMVLTDMQKELYTKMESLKHTAANNQSIQSTPNDGFSSFNFEDIIPSVTDSEKTALLANTENTNSHRVLDLHPTSSVFLGI